MTKTRTFENIGIRDKGDMAIFAPTTLAHPGIVHQNENLVRAHPQDHDRRPKGYFSWGNYAGPKGALFGAAGNLNIIRFAIINFAYNAETISRTLVTRSTSSRTIETGTRDCCLGLSSAAG